MLREIRNVAVWRAAFLEWHVFGTEIVLIEAKNHNQFNERAFHNKLEMQLNSDTYPVHKPYKIRSLGAGEGNRTLVCSLGSCRSAIELRPQINDLAKFDLLF